MNSIIKAMPVQSLTEATGVPTVAPKRVASESLLGEAKALLILHNGREYQLRLTQNGKLILTA